MKSKVKVPAHYGNIDALKSSSFNFLENERYHTVNERETSNIGQFENGTETSKSCEKLQQSTKMSEDLQKHKPVEVVISNERVVSGTYSPKRYVTTCYFQPKQLPVWYSETMILNIGSTKKKFFESIYYENKLTPFHWSETMTTRIPDKEEGEIISSNIDIPIEKPEFHYISLEPQQKQQIAT